MISAISRSYLGYNGRAPSDGISAVSRVSRLYISSPALSVCQPDGFVRHVFVSVCPVHAELPHGSDPMPDSLQMATHSGVAKLTICTWGGGQQVMRWYCRLSY